MNGQAMGKNVPAYLWEERGIVPLLKVDKGLEDERDGARLMKPIPGLDDLLTRAKSLGVAGTKMRSVINLANEAGVTAVVDQQFAIAAQIAGHGLMPIVETEVLITSPEKGQAETLLLGALGRALDASADAVALKLTLLRRRTSMNPCCATLALAGSLRSRAAIRAMTPARAWRITAVSSPASRARSSRICRCRKAMPISRTT